MKLLTILLVVSAWVPLFMTPAAGQDLSFGEGAVLSTDGAFPGGAASKAKLLGLTKTPGATLDGRLVAVFGDANSEHIVWDPKARDHQPRDIFVRYSDDEGATWSAMVNLSNTARHWSAMADSDGDGVLEPYWGDSGKPNVFSSGANIVVSWVDRYAPEAGRNWGENGESAVQGRAVYPDLYVPELKREIPFCAVYVAVSSDGGTTWTYGGDQPPLQLTYARRDAAQDAHRGSGKRWIVTWQEDHLGLQPGEADGPGDGASGANTSRGTDIWYAFTDDIVADAACLRDRRTPLSTNSAYDVTDDNGFPAVLIGVEHRAASRANPFLINDGGVFKALVAYEETKGFPDLLTGKTIQFHAFPFDDPVVRGPDTWRYGMPGEMLTHPVWNSRRVRFVAQPPDGVVPAIAMFWRSSLGDEGAPSDVVLKVSKTLDPADLAAAPELNISTATPTADMATLLHHTEWDAIEDARAHRAVLRGNLLAVGYTYTWNGPLARFTDIANYDFWIRRSLDGGVTWLAPQNLSQLPDTTLNVKEPRLVMTPNTGTQDDAAFVAAWGLETNVYEGIDVPVPVDIQITRTFDQGASFDPVVPLADSLGAEYECQLRVTPDGTKVAAVWMDDGLTKEARFGWSSPWQDLGSALAGNLGEPELRGVGTLVPGAPTTLTVGPVQPFAPIGLLYSTGITPVGFKGGVLVPIPIMGEVFVAADAQGGFELDLLWWPDAPVGFGLTLQGITPDPGAPFGIAITNGLRATTR
jgi:hypothetical protein